MITLLDAARCPYCARPDRAGREGRAVRDGRDRSANRPAWLYEKNPVGKVPVLEEDGWVLPESAVIAEYLDERYPEPLWPEDAGERAVGRLLVFRFDDFSRPYYALRRGEEGARERFEAELAALDRLLEAELALRARVRAGGRRLPALGAAVGGRARISLDPWPEPRSLGRARVRAAVGRSRARARRGVVTVVYLHAFPLDERMWPMGAQAPRLYGRGRTMDEWAESVLEEFPAAVLVGASMGGYCALAAARLARSGSRGRARRLAARRRLAGAAREARGDARARARGAEGIWRSMREALFPPRRGSRPGRADRRDRPRPDRGRARRRRRGDPRPARLHRRLPCSRQSSLTIVGDRDPFVPVEDARGFDPAAVVLDGCGHLPSLQRPEDFGRHVEQAVERWT